MKPFHMTPILTVVVLLVAAPAWPQNLRPGRYEVTGEVDLGRFAMKPSKDFTCITADQVNDPAKLLLQEKAAGCKAADVETTGSTIRFTITCEEDGIRTTSTSELTFGADWYTGLVRKEGDGRVITVRSKGKRVGDCAE